VSLCIVAAMGKEPLCISCCNRVECGPDSAEQSGEPEAGGAGAETAAKEVSELPSIEH